ncbi:MAG: hypothetical protein IPP90_08415 [Gemmatimonadaceae bacterium]|nr:hypothetical protein [Gemmatimonadaceae bacterium]
MSQAFTELRRRSPALTALAVMHLALLAVFMVALQIDAVQVLGIPRWFKPAKFAVSIAIYLTTIAWLLPSTGLTERTRRRLVGVIGTTMILEMMAITVQAARGTTSHFNIATLFDAVIFQSMGIAILLNTIAAAWLCVGAWGVLRREPTGTQAGVAMGFAVFLVGSAVGGWIVANNAHTVGAPDGGPGLPFVNWSTTAGDLRIAHFVGMHALQVLPVVGTMFGRRAVYGAALAWTVLTAALAVQAAMGSPLL